VFKLIDGRNGWRIAEVWERVLHSNLTIERSQ
jgi:hypothetical protein